MTLNLDARARGDEAIAHLRGGAGLIDRALRVDKPELLDLDATPAIVKQRILDDVEKISRLLLLYPYWTYRLGKMLVEARRTRRGKPVRVLDVGAGSGGLLFRIDDWARRRRIPVELHGLDYNDAAAHALERRAAEEGRRVESHTGDARELPFDAGDIDVVVTTFMLHHLAPGDVACVLGELDRVAAVNYLAFDLRRNVPSVPALWALVHAIGFDAPTRHDSMVSLRRAYTPVELEALAIAAGISNFAITAIPPAFVTITRA